MAERRARVLAGLTLVVAGIGTAVLARLRIYSTIFLFGAVALGAAGYLIATWRRGGLVPEEALPLSVPTRKRIVRIATIFFLLLTAASLLVLRTEQYEKAPVYFLLVAASAGFVALRICLLDSNEGVISSLGMVLAIALNLSASDQIAFPLGIGGGDSSAHIQFLVEPIVQTGFIPPPNPCRFFYGTFPASHLLVAIGSVLTGANPIRAYYGLGAFVMTLPVVVAFLIGRSIFGTRIGLLSALMLSGSSYFLYWATHAAALTFGLPLVAVLIVSLFLMLQGRNLRMLFVGGLAALALVLTHPYSTIVFGLILVGLVVGQVIIRGAPRPWPWGTRIVGVSFVYTLLIYWSNFTCLMTKSLALTEQYYNLLSNETLAPAGASYNRLPLPLIFFNTAGDTILQFLVIFGFFLMFARGLNPRLMMIVGPTLFLFTISIVGLVSPLTYLNPNRIYVFLQVIGFAPLAALAIRNFVQSNALPSIGRRSTRRTVMRAAVGAIVVATFIFASSASSIAGFETSVFGGDQPYVKLYDTPFEVVSADWLCAYLPGSVNVSASPSMFALNRFDVEACITPRGGFEHFLPVTPGNRIDVSFLEPGSFAWFSQYDKFPGFQSGLLGPNVFGAGQIARLDPTGDASLEAFDRLYDNGAVQVYLVSG